jgi:adenylylsulfate kinase (apsK)
MKRGEVAVKLGEKPPKVSNRLKAVIFWLGNQELRPDQKYLFRIGTAKVGMAVEKILRIWNAADINNKDGNLVSKHEIAECIITLDRKTAFDRETDLTETGRFVIIDDYNIAGGGIVLEELCERKPPLKNLLLSGGQVTFQDRCRLLKQQGIVLWFTGLSGAGKSTITMKLEEKLIQLGRLAYRLDGDNIRSGLNSDLGFTLTDRDENIRRISEVAALFKDCGIITLVSFIAPTRRMREKARNITGEVSFVEIYVKASVETCKNRDVKGLYKKAYDGKINNFTGVSSSYEEPDCPNLILDTEAMSADECVDLVLEFLTNTGKL